MDPPNRRESPARGTSADRPAPSARGDRRGARRSPRRRGRGASSLEGEPGIGKSRLLGVRRPESAEGCTVLGGARVGVRGRPAASAVHRGARPPPARRAPRSARLTDPEALAGALPALGVQPVPADRHRMHRALRDLLERLAAARPLVLCLDDVHWADPASVDALAALVRRPPAGPVLLARRRPERRCRRRSRPPSAGPSRRAGRPRSTLAPLSEAEAAELVGDGAPAVYAQAGGNPFYLEQLARAGAPGAADAPAGDESIPPPSVPRAPSSRRSRARGAPAARRGRGRRATRSSPASPPRSPSWPRTARSRRSTSCCSARSSAPPGRRGGSRSATRSSATRSTTRPPGGWRLGAHARAAAELERRGAGPVERAHHVEHAATPGDEAAIAVLRRRRPRGCRRPRRRVPRALHAAALRLLPERATTASGMRAARRRAGRAGDAVGARATLLGALRTRRAGRPARAHRRRSPTRSGGSGDHEDARRSAPGRARRPPRRAVARPRSACVSPSA